MESSLRVEFFGAIYHVTCRMVGSGKTEKTLLFKDDAGYAGTSEDFKVALKISPRSIGSDGFCLSQTVDQDGKRFAREKRHFASSRSH